MAIIGWVLVALILFFILLFLPKNLFTYITCVWVKTNHPDWLDLLPSYHRMFWNPCRWSVVSWLHYMTKKLNKQLKEQEKLTNQIAKENSIDPAIARQKIIEWCNSPEGQEFKRTLDEINRKGKERMK
jgi:poly-D-alanine transfer protein DltD